MQGEQFEEISAHSLTRYCCKFVLPPNELRRPIRRVRVYEISTRCVVEWVLLLLKVRERRMSRLWRAPIGEIRQNRIYYPYSLLIDPK